MFRERALRKSARVLYALKRDPQERRVYRWSENEYIHEGWEDAAYFLMHLTSKLTPPTSAYCPLLCTFPLVTPLHIQFLSVISFLCIRFHSGCIFSTPLTAGRTSPRAYFASSCIFASFWVFRLVVCICLHCV